MKPPDTISASCVKTLYCPKLWSEVYEKGNRSPANEHTIIGSIVHDVMESCGVNVFRQPFAAIEEQLKKTWTEYISKPGIEGDLATRLFNGKQYTEVLDILSNIYNNDVHRNEAILAVEHEFTLPTRNGIVIHGFMDRVSIVDAEILEITDYKTGGYIPDYEDLCNDPQPAFYILAMWYMQKNPEYASWFEKLKKVRFRLFYARYGKEVFVEKTEQEIYAYEQYLEALVGMLPDMEPKPVLNNLCSYCHICHECERYQKRNEERVYGYHHAAMRFTDDNIGDVLEYYDTLKAIYSSTDGEIQKLRRKLFAFLEEKDSKEFIANNGYTVSCTDVFPSEYDYKEVFQVAKSRGFLPSVISLSAASAKKLLSPEEFKKLEATKRETGKNQKRINVFKKKEKRS